MSKPQFLAPCSPYFEMKGGVVTAIKADITSLVEDVVDDINEVECRHGMLFDKDDNLIQIFADGYDLQKLRIN